MTNSQQPANGKSVNYVALGFFLMLATVVIGGGWSLFVYFWPSTPATTGITLQDYEAGLKRREAEIRAEQTKKNGGERTGAN